MHSFATRWPMAFGTTLIALVAGLLALDLTPTLTQDVQRCVAGNLNTRNWSTDFCQSIVDFDEILVGQPGQEWHSVGDRSADGVSRRRRRMAERALTGHRP